MAFGRSICKTSSNYPLLDSTRWWFSELPTMWWKFVVFSWVTTTDWAVSLTHGSNSSWSWLFGVLSTGERRADWIWISANETWSKRVVETARVDERRTKTNIRIPRLSKEDNYIDRIDRSKVAGVMIKRKYYRHCRLNWYHYYSKHQYCYNS